MAEIIPEKDWEATHLVGHESFFLDVYRLLSHCLSSREIAALNDGTTRRGLPSVDKAEISRLLIHIATYYRVKYDDGSWEHAKWLHDNYYGVGLLVSNLETPTEPESLSFKEACNKIIHAKKVHFDGNIDQKTKAEYINPIIHLYGDKGGKEWKATLEVVEFCKAAFHVIV